MLRMTTAEATVDALQRHGMDTLYALPGVHNDHLFDAVCRTAGRMRLLHPRHEQTAAYMALGAALATGRPQAYAVVPGPGILNTSAALLTAWGTGAPVLAIAGQMNKPVQDLILGLFSKKATAVMTNVPGPGVPLRFCGSTLRQTMFWVPSSGDIGVGVSILSYGGGVQFGLITDEALCPDPQAIVDAFAPEFEMLSLLAMMLPWGEA